MTCRGYDSKAVKVPKSVKRLAATILDNHLRSAFIKDYVKMFEAQTHTRTGKRNK